MHRGVQGSTKSPGHTGMSGEGYRGPGPEDHEYSPPQSPGPEHSTASQMLASMCACRLDREFPSSWSDYEHPPGIVLSASLQQGKSSGSAPQSVPAAGTPSLVGGEDGLIERWGALRITPAKISQTPATRIALKAMSLPEPSSTSMHERA